MRLHQLKKGPTMRQQAPRWTLVIKRCPLLLCLSLAVHSGQIVTVTSHTLIESCNLTSTQQKGRDSVYIRHTQPQISTFGPLPPSQPRPYNLSWSQFDTSLTLSYSMGRMWSHGYPHLMIFFHTDSPPAGYSPVFLSSLIVMLSYWRPHSVCPHIQHYICAIKHTHTTTTSLFFPSVPLGSDWPFPSVSPDILLLVLCCSRHHIALLPFSPCTVFHMESLFMVFLHTCLAVALQEAM